MAVPAEAASLDDVPEAFRDEYVEKGGKYVLQVDNPDQLPSVQGLKSAFEKVTRERDRLKGAIEKFGDRTPEEIAEMEEQLEELRQSKGGEPTQEEAKRIEERIAAKYEKKYRPVEQENEKIRTHLHRTLVDRELDAALDKVGFDQRHKPLLRSFLKERGPKVIEDGDEFRGVFSTDVGGIPGDHSIADYVEEWAKQDEAKAYMPATNRGGSGANPEGGGGKAGSGEVVNRNDPMSWGTNADKIASGEVTVSE